MSLDNFQLPSLLIHELYKESLVLLDEQQIIEEKSVLSNPASFRHLGDYQKKILILVAEPGLLHISDEDLKLLTSLLNTCQSTLQDVALVNVLQNGAGFHTPTLIEQFQPDRIMIFCDDPSQLNLPFQLESFTLSKALGVKILTSVALSTLNTQRALKQKLWPQPLKDFFEI